MKILTIILFFLFGFLYGIQENKKSLEGFGEILKNEEIINHLEKTLNISDLCTSREYHIYDIGNKKGAIYEIKDKKGFYIYYMGKGIKFVKLKEGVIIC